MRTWFQCKVKYPKENEEGLLKMITEQYLVDAVSFTEAEAMIHTELGDQIRGDFQVTGVAKSNIVDVYEYSDHDIWWKVKISYMLIDDHSGREKTVNQHILLTAGDISEACERTQESLSNMLVTFRVTQIIESPIIEVFPYEREEDESGR